MNRSFPRNVALLAILGVAAASLAALAADPQPKPFAAGDPEKGKKIVETDCVSCHAQRFKGDADQMYLRPDHRVKTPEQLLSQVRVCNSQLSKNYFPDEEEHIAAYLNSRFYKFKP
jgi:mono/diheme cytochrome c family protein